MLQVNVVAAICLLLCSHAVAQCIHTGNKAYDSPHVNRPHLAVKEPESARTLSRRLQAFHQRSLLTNNKWGKPTADAHAVFPQAVASGDPLEDSVIIWTRVPGRPLVAIDIDWAIAKDADFKDGFQSGTAITGCDVDYTVKIDVTGLEPGTWYYYQFRLGSSYSMIGRTRTLPAAAAHVDSVNMAVVSCSNFPVGYFHAYKTIAQYAEEDKLDAVLHLGDYLYEYNSTSALPAGEEDRTHCPLKEMVTLEDYRTRHEQYDSDPDLKHMRTVLPLIAVWDDHEFTNNAYRYGAQNHANDNEFPALRWKDRKDNAIRAYYEYMPVRQADPDNIDRIYRNFKWGDLVNLMMLDTRYIGRDEQYTVDFLEFSDKDPRYKDPFRSMLGFEQRQWLYNQLEKTNKEGVTWKLVGQQVQFTKGYYNIPGTDKKGLNEDAWDGYAAERDAILDLVEEKKIDNFMVLTGDVHVSFAYDIVKEPKEYNPKIGKGALGVEFVCNSVTSNGFGASSECAAAQFETTMLEDNPNLWYVQSRYKGFLWLQITHESTTGIFVDHSTVKTRDYKVSFSDRYVAKAGANRIIPEEGPLPRTPVNKLSSCPAA